MKKPLIDIKRINNDDVIATSTCSVNLNTYDVLFQSNGHYIDEGNGASLYFKAGKSFQYNNGTWSYYNPWGDNSLYAYIDFIPEMVDGKWYHFYSYYDGEDYVGEVVKCTDSNHHGVNAD